VWQELRGELYPQGLEIVTVALDTAGPQAVRRWIEAAKPEHPSLIDQAHVVDELFGIVNVPSGIWIDEDGIIVRPPETAYPRRPPSLDRETPANLSPEQREQIDTVKNLRIDAETYIIALRNWVTNGPESRYALPPDEVLRRSRPRPLEEARAAAHFELGQYLHRAGQPQDAIAHFRECHRLQPDNWTYMRQAWNLLDSGQTALDVYETDWLREVKKIGAEKYYPKLEM
jgi:tetratricopeptide (TPR) repeat protein